MAVSKKVPVSKHSLKHNLVHIPYYNTVPEAKKPIYISVK